ncbi:MAG: phosphoenolpyruvate synthase [Myxococcales bacterium]|nr:phosphoenolpyruvate synthase [Myxococcales bacterium]MCB9715403.1 phosphoenolpyruvate synthase [Myxococcales bacterium]
MVRYCIPFEELGLDDVPRVGGKTASLGELVRSLGTAGVRVPGGFAVTADAYSAVLDQGELRAQLHALIDDCPVGDAAELARRGHAARQLVRGAGLPAEVAAEIRGAYAAMAASGGEVDPSVAVRSSATAEDLPEASFAGQQATHLNVRGERAVLDAVADCFASVFTDRAIVYRHVHGFDHFAVRGAVAIQRMVRADLGAAGVIFTLDPDSGHRGVVLVTGAWGLGESVVAGQVDPDEVWVWKDGLGRAREPILRRKIGRKQTKIVYARRGAATTRVVPVPRGDRERRCFSDEDAVALARWAVAIEAHYSERHGRPTPMDIEWVKDGRSGELWIVQARPETVQARADAGSLLLYTLEGAPAPRVTGVAIGSAVGQGIARVIERPEDLGELRDGEVLVTEMTDPDWVPALRRAAAVVTDRGGRTCHAAIVSRELGVPCVVGTGDGTRVLRTGEPVTVSCARGTQGEVFEGRVPFRRERVALGELPSTRTKIMLILADPDRALEEARLPVAGVGLVRQEFVAANHIGVHPMAALQLERVDAEARARIEAMSRGYESPAAMWETRLAEGIGTIAAAFHPRPVIVRLSDFKSNEYRRLVGGEAFEPEEENPMIGLRGASRYRHPRFAEAFALECRALRRVRQAMGLRNVQLMVPFCRTVEEGRRVIELLAEHGLRQGEDELKVWVMCEIPANVAAVDLFSAVFDGFSIGSNDLTQLVLGVDRDSELLTDLFRERDPAVMRTIAAAIRGAHEHGRPIGLCGQAPSDDVEFAGFLVREGIDSVSLNPDAVLRAWAVVAAAEREAGKDG